MQQIGDPETSLKLEQSTGRAVVPDPSLRPSGIENEIGIAQQALDRRTRHRALGVMVEDDPPFPVGERNKTDPYSVAVRDGLLQIGLRSEFVDASVDRLGRRARHVRRDSVL